MINGFPDQQKSWLIPLMFHFSDDAMSVPLSVEPPLAASDEALQYLNSIGKHSLTFCHYHNGVHTQIYQFIIHLLH